jgi:hypothetical protein
MTYEKRHFRPSNGVWIACVCVAVYFGLFLVPHAIPGLGGTGLSFAYALSLPIVVLLLLVVGVWGGVGLLRARVRGRPLRPRHRAYVLVGCVALASFTLTLGLARALPRPLPTRSHLQRFDRAAWQDPRSAHYVPGDVTPRQKMLADVVKSILPGRTRAEIEKTLGLSLETPYFKSTGRDLIYVLGPQRDSYFTIDSEWLLVWLDKDGRFKRYAIAND